MTTVRLRGAPAWPGRPDRWGLWGVMSGSPLLEIGRAAAALAGVVAWGILLVLLAG
jgi:hypothetical protein